MDNIEIAFILGETHDMPITNKERRVHLIRMRRQTAEKLIRINDSNDPRRWPDYRELFRARLHQRKEDLLLTLLQRFDELIKVYPNIEITYNVKLRDGEALHKSNATRAKRRAKLFTLNVLGSDLRYLGKFERFVEGKVTYGFDTD